MKTVKIELDNRMGTYGNNYPEKILEVEIAEYMLKDYCTKTINLYGVKIELQDGHKILECAENII